MLFRARLVTILALDPDTYFLAISSFNNAPVGVPPTFPNGGGSSGSYEITLSGVQTTTYSLGASPTDLPEGTGIFFEDDLIAIVQDVSPSDLNLSSNNFVFV